jgi:hypothetical protein
LARDWFSDPKVKEQIAGLLREFKLDETAIEAEAFRKSADDLERIDRLMASSEARRDKALVCIAQYRGDFGAAIDLSTAKFSNSSTPAAKKENQRPSDGNRTTNRGEPSKRGEEYRAALFRREETGTS